jgi:hypothetical protein
MAGFSVNRLREIRPGDCLQPASAVLVVSLANGDGDFPLRHL